MTSCSLLVPCHNAADYLPRLWETVRTQTLPFDEIIFYDDGSTDNTAVVARNLGVQVIQSENCRGAAFARNQLAQAATCAWIHFHDADDTLHPDYLARSKSQIRDALDVIVCDADWIDETTHQLLIPLRYTLQSLEIHLLASTIANPIGVISCLYRRETFLSIGGFNESLSCWEDGDLHVRLAAAGARFVAIGEVLSYSLRHSRGLSSDQLMCSQCRLRLLQEYAETLDSSVNNVIAEEAEKVADRLLVIFGDWKAARKAITLCRSLGRIPPTTNNPSLKLLKLIFPSIILLYIQGQLRSRLGLVTKNS